MKRKMDRLEAELASVSIFLLDCELRSRQRRQSPQRAKLRRKPWKRQDWHVLMRRLPIALPIDLTCRRGRHQRLSGCTEAKAAKHKLEISALELEAPFALRQLCILRL